MKTLSTVAAVLLVGLVLCGCQPQESAPAPAPKPSPTAVSAETGQTTSGSEAMVAPTAAIPGMKIPKSASPSFHVEFLSHTLPASVVAGTTRAVVIRLANRGSEAWNGKKPLYIAYHLYAQDGKRLVWDGHWMPVKTPVQPGQEATTNAVFDAPKAPGEYYVAWDLVKKGETWASWKGSRMLTLRVNVTSP